jgi:hypothetical protein
LIKRDYVHKKLYPELIGQAVLSGDKSEAPSAENPQGRRSSTRGSHGNDDRLKWRRQ